MWLAHSEAVKKSNQGDFLIKMRRCRILIGGPAVVPLRSPTADYKTHYLGIALGVCEKTRTRVFSHTVPLVRFFHSLSVCRRFGYCSQRDARRHTECACYFDAPRKRGG